MNYDLNKIHEVTQGLQLCAITTVKGRQIYNTSLFVCLCYITYTIFFPGRITVLVVLPYTPKQIKIQVQKLLLVHNQ